MGNSGANLLTNRISRVRHLLSTALLVVLTFGQSARADEMQIAWVWNEECLAAIRVDRARPTVQARTLFHVSAAMYDAWAAFDAIAEGYLSKEKLPSTQVDADRRVAISYAAFAVLRSRYGRSPGSIHTLTALEGRMRMLGFDPEDRNEHGPGPAALGNRVGRLYASVGDSDGSRELQNYLERPRFVPRNKPMNVDAVGCTLNEPDHWQPLTVYNATQRCITPHWGKVSPFAFGPSDLQASGFTGPPLFDTAGVENLRRQMLEVIRFTSVIDPGLSDLIDISPGAIGSNPLASDSGTGLRVNPATGVAYAPNVVKLADFGRALADFWADGPGSDTPPGHWNQIARRVSQTPGLDRKIRSVGNSVSPDEWDVKLLFALNAALHDAAINAWALKSEFDSVRPISAIRWMGMNGQCTEKEKPSFHVHGLPLVPGLIEIVTEESSAPGQRHQHLSNFIGKIAVLGWAGPVNPPREVMGVRWRLASEWMPFQQWDFVTPAFPGYVSGHSTFSRAAAEVLASFTGNPMFPGGMFEEIVAADTGLRIEPGPSQEVRLQWATYFDAADSSGRSRRWGGIHIESDDFDGRRLGSKVAAAVLERCYKLFNE